MTYRILLTIAATMMFLAACIPLPAGPAATLTSDAANPSATLAATSTEQLSVPTATLAPEPIPSEVASPTPGQPGASGAQFIAYVRDGQLMVTDVTNGVQGGTTQYTTAGENDQVADLVWSPSGEILAFVSPVQGELHLFYIFALGQSSPVDLGPGSAPAWSPDSRSIAYVRGSYPNDNIWITPIENPTPRQLTFEANYAWGRPTFTPDGEALIVTSADRINMGAQGNTSFLLERLELRGSGTPVPLPGATLVDGGRLPYDLRFSPDGARLAFSTSMHFSACASPGAYYVSNPEGGDRQEFVSPSLKEAIDPSRERYHVGLNYAWSIASDALVVTGIVVDCDFNSPTMGQAVAGPQISILGLDGSARLVIPGTFHSLSMDRGGTWIGAAHYQDPEDLNPMVEIYSAQTGQFILSLGPGSSPQLQP